VGQYISHHVIRYTSPSGEIHEVKVLGQSHRIMDPALGTYSFAVYAVDVGGRYSTSIGQAITLSELTHIELVRISGLELKGKGNVTEFEGRDAHFTWRMNSATYNYEMGDEPLGAGSGSNDPWFLDYEVTVYTPGLFDTVRRVEHVTDPEYVYTLEKNKADGNGTPIREFIVSVAARDKYNRTSPDARIMVNNPPPVDFGLVNYLSSIGAIFVEYTKPTDPDYVSTRLYGSLVPGFAPGPDNLLNESADYIVGTTGLPAGTYYVRLEGVDAFGPAGIFTSPVAVVANATADVQQLLEGAVTESMLNASLTEAISANGIPAYNQGTAYAKDDAVLYDGGMYVALQDMPTPPVPLTSDTAYWQYLGPYTTVSAAVAGNSVAVAESMTAIANLEGDVTNLYAEYMVKLDVNGYVSGFGLANDGATSEAAFLVDTFSIVSPGATAASFLVEGGKVVMDGAHIKQASIETAAIEDIIHSSNYEPGVAGWALTSSTGAFEANSGTFRGNVDVASIDIGGPDATSFHIDTDGNAWAGAALFAAAPFRVSSSGQLTALSGQFSGKLDIGTGNTSFHVDQSGNMWSGHADYGALAPFRVTNAGVMHCKDAYVNGNFSVASTGNIKGGATGYNAGNGFWFGYHSGAYKAFIGNASGNKLLYDGTNLWLTGKLTASAIDAINTINIAGQAVTIPEGTLTGAVNLTSTTWKQVGSATIYGSIGQTRIIVFSINVFFAAPQGAGTDNNAKLELQIRRNGGTIKTYYGYGDGVGDTDVIGDAIKSTFCWADKTGGTGTQTFTVWARSSGPISGSGHQSKECVVAVIEGKR
jgi:hypothetical protein